MGSGKSKPSNSVDKSSNNGKRSSAEYNRTPVKSNLVTARPSSTPAPINKATPSPAPIIKAVDEEAQLVENFRLAFKASPTDGWRKLVSGESVSVFVNNSGKLPFNMTLALGSSISSFAEILAGVSDASSSAQYLLKTSLGVCLISTCVMNEIFSSKRERM